MTNVSAADVATEEKHNQYFSRRKKKKTQEAFCIIETHEMLKQFSQAFGQTC